MEQVDQIASQNVSKFTNEHVSNISFILNKISNMNHIPGNSSSFYLNIIDKLLDAHEDAFMNDSSSSNRYFIYSLSFIFLNHAYIFQQF